jgi:hypothetical protein
MPLGDREAYDNGNRHAMTFPKLFAFCEGFQNRPAKFSGEVNRDPKFLCGDGGRDVNRFVTHRSIDAPSGPKRPPFARKGPNDLRSHSCFVNTFGFARSINHSTKIADCKETKSLAQVL